MGKNNFKEWQFFLMRPVDASSLAVFRILFGFLLAWYAFQLVSLNEISPRYIEPNFHFSFSLFEFLHLKKFSAPTIYAFFKIMTISACCIALGIFYRLAVLSFFLTFGYFFLLEKAYFNNHYYLILLITFLMFFMGAHRCASMDGLRNPKINTGQVPFWAIFILRAQICIVYFFSGITKISKDFLDGKQMHYWLVTKGHLPPLPSIIPEGWIIQLFIYGGLFIDLTIGFFLCYKPTRIFAFVIAIMFHLLNKQIFNIEIFHYFMIAALILFVDPDEPRRFFNKILHFFKPSLALSSNHVKKNNHTSNKFLGKLVAVFVCVYLLVQILIPFRHLLYPGNINWTREGHRFSWRLKANITSGIFGVIVIDPSTQKAELMNPLNDLKPEQFIVMSKTPDMILQYVHFLKERYQKQGVENPIIKVHSELSVNVRPYRPYINKNINLAEKKYPLFSHADWLLPPPEDLAF